MFCLDPSNANFVKSASLIISSVGGLTAIILFIVGFLRYSKDQNWKRKEFVAKEIEKFHANPLNQKALLMLDWGKRKIELFPQKSNYDERFVFVNREILRKALLPHEHVPKYTEVETAIRDCFDNLLGDIEKFDHFIESGLVDRKEFDSYLIYWIDTIAEELPTEVKINLHHYIEYYNFTGVKKFFERYEKNITPSAPPDNKKR